MRKRITWVLILMMVSAFVFAGEIELGVGLTPLDKNASYIDAYEGDFFDNSSLTAHLGYGFWGIFYATLDGIVMNPTTLDNFAGISSSYGKYGVLTTADLGLRLNLEPIMLTAQLGLNNLFVEDSGATGDWGGVGSNFKLGAGLRFGAIGAMLELTSLQPSPIYTFYHLDRLFNGSDSMQRDAVQHLFQYTLLNMGLVLYL